MLNKALTYIVYDGDCPFCSRYVHLLRLRDAVGPVELVNARDSHPAIDFVEKAGVQLDNEMALILGGQIFSGSACINRLALLSTRSTTFNRITGLLFSAPVVTRLAYPIMRTARNGVLRLLGRQRIRPN